MPELSAEDIKNVASRLWSANHDILGRHAIHNPDTGGYPEALLEYKDSHGFNLGVLTTLKMIEEAAGEILSTEKLTDAIPAAVESTDRLVQETRSFPLSSPYLNPGTLKLPHED